ncbi:GIY-YIG nuclease family protein [Robbsia sp. Bb-Pol-6]|uniref:GIY-YIG nuclease family protein n=1 Tax=Robbsia betulipollinis TaxID=2981849 RepID=A0ABT3ZNR9_9BURK|nr:GIY-YIG nuclease family protein [Robbsia betulipollinis]MCY0387900.1 GIY-YIG nuclease family protein [Robbsia betulipollinis]
MTNNEGYVYVLTNPSLPSQVKVGRTERDPHTRLRELSAATGVPTPFELAYSAHFLDCHAAEASAHAEWKDKRVNDGREFFRVTVSEALRVLRNLSAIERQTNDPQVIEDLLIRGRQYLFGAQGVLRNPERALSLFEEAAAMGSAGAAYFAGRAAYKLGDDGTRQGKAQQAKAKAFMERALGHFQTAIGLGHANACA